MSANRTLLAKGAWYSDLSEIQFARDALTFVDRGTKARHQIAVGDIQMLTIEGGPLRNGLKVKLKSGRTLHFGGLQKKESQQIKTAIEGRILALRTEEEKRLDQNAERKARKLKPQILELLRNVTSLLAGDRYTRYSELTELSSTINSFVAKLDRRLRDKLDPEARKALSSIEALADPGNLEAERRKGNWEFISEAAARVKKSTSDITSNPLTDEQATAVATDEDATLVLAGAGTGKTSVITGKIAHLVRNQGVPAESVLALAFNVDAAQEIRERLPEDLVQTQVFTFHSFAYKTIGEATGKAPTVSTLAGDEVAYQQAIDGSLSEMLAGGPFMLDVIALLTSEYAEYKSPFDFTTERGYREYVRTTEPRTFNGGLVKSQEELALANFFASNSVAYEYEKPYRFSTATSQHRQYQPDFYLPDYDIYIEHFAVDEQGRPPQGWIGYAEGMAWKRSLHRERQTSLVETYSWERSKGILLEGLERKLRELGVQFSPVSAEELVDKLAQFRVRRLAVLLGTFLHHAKSSDMTDAEIAAAAEGQLDGYRTRRFLRVFSEIRRRYEEGLAAEQAKDFHDLINEAAVHIRTVKFENPFDYVLIDEFQDISKGRMDLAKALKKPGLAYFMVGDDWQSIYRFAGSYVGLIHSCDQHLGFTERVKLTRTFRFGEGIAQTSTGFIQKNPEQTSRELSAGDRTDDDHGVTVIVHENAAEGVRQALLEIDRMKSSPNDTVKVLGRYHRSVANLREETAAGRSNIEFSTIHRAKGLEADHVVVADLKDDRRYGFPSQMVDDPLLNIVMPPTHGDPFPFAEERRLFYVALTRARKGAYLVTDPIRPSPFVRELTRDYPNISQVGLMLPSCPDCSSGAMIPSQTENNLRCTNYPVCRHLWPRCPECNRGYAFIDDETNDSACTNSGCDAPAEICPRCERGLLILREGRRGFWGCSRYWAEPSCRYTEEAQE